MSKNIVQLNNSFIQNEYQRRRYLMKERQKRNRFMGGVLILIMLLFILPTFNLAQSYQQLLQIRQQLADLQTQYQTLSDEKDKETAFATKLKDEDYAAKYTRAKYYYSKSREKVYTIPDLLQR
ncbi:TPA: septum formation initiator family protein [Streptococcus pneumoniae]|nr:septum formation initiator family protein [Streptococcus pneumoniae]